ncbi:MAG: T9SS type A sorting domain-containing protein [Flavobacteriales bacterium]|nr:T9SS type A sorting domain-containing protein [Flavobacteriales bacterium]
MRNTFLILSFIIGLTFTYNLAYATQYESKTNGGDWTDPTTWNPVGIPNCGDTVTIVAGYTVKVTSNIDYTGCAQPMFIEIYGTLEFIGGGSKLKLPSGSGVEIHAGGSIKSSGSGGGSSKTLEIGGATVWKASDGNLSGPAGFGSTLPIELISFEAVFNEDQVDLYWSTASESNSSHFIIERSKDGSYWDELIRVDAAGNSTTIKDYYEFDSEPMYGKSFYRLVQYDYNGDYEIFNAVPVENLEGGLVAFDIFPNPTTQDNINLSFKGFEGKEFLVVLRDISGKEYYSKVEIVNTDSEIIAYSPDVTLPKGVYLVTASSQNELYSQKIIIQ